MKKLFFILVISLSIISCETTNLVNKTKRLKLGMTKKELILLMGKDFKIVSASRTPDGDLEVISYNIISEESNYIMYLLNGKLDRWHETNKTTHHHNSFERINI